MKCSNICTATRLTSCLVYLLVTTVVSVGTVLGISTTNQRSLYTFETMWCDREVTYDIIVTVSTYSMIQRSLQVCNSCWVHLNTLTCAHYPNWVSVLQHQFKQSISLLYTFSSSIKTEVGRGMYIILMQFLHIPTGTGGKVRKHVKKLHENCIIVSTGKGN